VEIEFEPSRPGRAFHGGGITVEPVFPVDLYFIYPDALYSYQYSADEIREIEGMFRRVIEEIKEKFPFVSS
jgi:formylmethanofuran dehydrogenase subunit C